MFKKIVLAALVLGVTIASGCSTCNKCKKAEPTPCNTCSAPCGETCDK